MLSTTVASMQLVEDAAPTAIFEEFGKMAGISYYVPPIAPERRPSDLAGTFSLVHNLDRLAADWNGYGASPISRMAQLNALTFLVRLVSFGHAVPDPDVYPQDSGTVGFSWDTPDGNAFIEFGETRYSGYITRQGRDDLYFDGDASNTGSGFALALHDSLSRDNPSILVRVTSLTECIGDEDWPMSLLSGYRQG